MDNPVRRPNIGSFLFATLAMMIVDLPKLDGPRLPRHFGLRTMLIAMTAMAVALGLVVWFTS